MKDVEWFRGVPVDGDLRKACSILEVYSGKIEEERKNLTAAYIMRLFYKGAFEIVPQNLKNIFGHAAYVMSGINELAKLRSIHAKITLEPGTDKEEVHEGDYVLGAVCNSKSIGGILNLEKLDVDMNDGLMEVLMIRMPKDLIELSDIATSTLGGTFKSHQIETYSAHSVRVELNEDIHWTLDGEYEAGSAVCEIKTLESAISLIR